MLSPADPTHTLTGNAKYLNTVQFSPTHGDKIVSGTDMGSLLVWKVKGIDSAVEGTAGAQNSPSLTRNMVVRKRNAEARIANTQTKLDKDRTDGDAEVSKLRCVRPVPSSFCASPISAFPFSPSLLFSCTLAVFPALFLLPTSHTFVLASLPACVRDVVAAVCGHGGSVSAAGNYWPR